MLLSGVPIFPPYIVVHGSVATASDSRLREPRVESCVVVLNLGQVWVYGCTVVMCCCVEPWASLGVRVYSSHVL